MRDGSTKWVSNRGFTILEILVATAVLAILLVIVLTTISGASSVTQRAGTKITSFQSARAGFDVLTDTLSQATLNSYWDYVDGNNSFLTVANANNFTPSRYARNSELHFCVGNAGIEGFPGTPGTGQSVGFQADTGYASPDFAGLNTLLNSFGFFVEYRPESFLPPPFPPPTNLQYRYRLMMGRAPSETLTVYDSSTGNSWLDDFVAWKTPIVENVIFLSIWPRKSFGDDADGMDLTSDFRYDSRLNVTNSPQPETAHQLPPIVDITMIVLDESSASRVCVGPTVPTEISAAFAGLFQTSSSDQFSADLASLQQRLGNQGLTYQVFRAEVPLRESKMQ